MNGIIIIDKPLGRTSHDMVYVMRKMTGIKKVGHTGTLDPEATGVLPVCIGSATKVADMLTLSDKCYRAELVLGMTTDTQDADGEVLTECEVTCSEDEIRQANDMGVICGVTTNPSLIAKEGRDFVEVVKEITTIVDGPISAEVISLEADKMVEEAKPLAAINKNIVIKIPMCAEGLKAVKKLTALGIKTNVTLIFSSAQALLAARAGATYVSPFLGRLDDIGTNGMILIEEIADIFKIHEIPTEIIAASIRNPIHVIDAARAGCDIATVPYKVIAQMLHHPLTDKGIERFLKDWETVPKN